MSIAPTAMNFEFVTKQNLPRFYSSEDQSLSSFALSTLYLEIALMPPKPFTNCASSVLLQPFDHVEMPFLGGPVHDLSGASFRLAFMQPLYDLEIATYAYLRPHK